MDMMQRYDLAVVDAGTAGLIAAQVAAAVGLVEYPRLDRGFPSRRARSDPQEGIHEHVYDVEEHDW